MKKDFENVLTKMEYKFTNVVFPTGLTAFFYSTILWKITKQALKFNNIFFCSVNKIGLFFNCFSLDKLRCRSPPSVLICRFKD